VNAFRSYEDDAANEIGRWEFNYAQLSPRHKCARSQRYPLRRRAHDTRIHPCCVPRALAAAVPAQIAAARAAVARNAAFFGAMLSTYESDDCPPHLRVPPPPPRDSQPARPTPGEAEKVRYVLRNLCRDWAEEGAAERQESYGPLLTALQKHLPCPPAPATPPRVLIPGAGLGGLCVDVAALGYAAEGNECSYYMLLPSSFVMNCLGSVGDDAPDAAQIYPFVLNSCNNVRAADASRPVAIPDVRAAAATAGVAPGGLSMAAGEFCEVYSADELAGSFDAALTCFFLDTSHNILDTIDVLARVLRPGALWANCGPLLYHWADAHTYLDAPEQSVELPLEDVIAAALAAGFEMVEQGTADCGYADNSRSMMRTRYRCATWTMVKRK
jgi:carnosine N-methyltransferase